MSMILNGTLQPRPSAGRTTRALSVLACLLGCTLPSLSLAMDMSVAGTSVRMSGPVVGDDCEQLRSILARTSIKTVILGQSKGGNADAGYCVGALIRENNISTVIQGSCASSCSRMWLGGVSRRLEGAGSRVGLHGNYDSQRYLRSGAPERLQGWIRTYVPTVDGALLEQWTNLPTSRQMMYFYIARAELCTGSACTSLPGRNASNAGLLTR